METRRWGRQDGGAHDDREAAVRIGPPDAVRTLCPSTAAPWWTVTGIFISYRREHTAVIVGRLHDRLADHFGGRQIVRDIETVNAGDDFDQRIDEVVASSDACLAIISNRWLLDRNPVGKRPIGVPRDWVEREIEVALRRAGVLVIPVLIDGATLPSEQELPYSIRSLAKCQAMHLSDLGWDDEIGKLIGALEEVVEPPGAPPASRALAPDARAAPVAGASAPLPHAPPTRRWFRKR